jgi:hypothetical protein
MTRRPRRPVRVRDWGSIPRLYRLVLILIRRVHLVSAINILLPIETLVQDDFAPLVIHPQLREYMLAHETQIYPLGSVIRSQVSVGH